MPARTPDQELQAIEALIAALEPLDSEARSRVVSYAFSRLGLRASSALSLPTSSPQSSPTSVSPLTGVTDIRTLKDEKAPRSAIEMALLMAYYLSEIAPAGERRERVNADDVKKYFKQGGYPLPKAPHMTLVHAKNAGYLDSVGEGTFRLNPVGYNLVVHGLPANSKAKRQRKRGKSRR